MTKDGVFDPQYGVDNGIRYLITATRPRTASSSRLQLKLFARMSTTVTSTETAKENTSGSISLQVESDYKYSHLLPVFPKDEHYPPLTPYEHVDPGSRALSEPNPRSFLANATVTQLTPPIGEEVRGVNLATLSNAEKDQLALEVSVVLS